MGEKHKKVCRTLIYFEHFIFIFAIKGCVSIYAFTSLVSVPVGISSSAVGLKICATTAGIKKYQKVTKFGVTIRPLPYRFPGALLR